MPIYYRSQEELRSNSGWRWYYFNETVGFIWLEPRPDAIRAEYCFIRQRPSRVLVRREFEPRGKLFQVSCKGIASSQIFDKLMLAFEDIRAAGFLSSYWIDLDAFERVGPTIDWQHHVCRRQ